MGTIANNKWLVWSVLVVLCISSTFSSTTIAASMIDMPLTSGDILPFFKRDYSRQSRQKQKIENGKLKDNSSNAGDRQDQQTEVQGTDNYTARGPQFVGSGWALLIGTVIILGYHLLILTLVLYYRQQAILAHEIAEQHKQKEKALNG